MNAPFFIIIFNTGNSVTAANYLKFTCQGSHISIIHFMHFLRIKPFQKRK